MKVKKEDKAVPSELRKGLILNQLKERGYISTREIAREANVSEITIRRDLAKLEEKGLLTRDHRGAVKNGSTGDLFAFYDKISRNSEEKNYICRIASRFIKAGDVIFIDCGSTVSLLVDYIKKIESLTVITNSLPITSELINFGNIKLILVGGEVNSSRRAIYGYSTINSISQYHANKAFIGADGISLLRGITSYNEKAASVTLKMAENSDEVFVLCDSSKIEKDSFVKFAPLSAINYIITDKKIDNMLIPKYDEHGIKLLCED